MLKRLIKKWLGIESLEQQLILEKEKLSKAQKLLENTIALEQRLQLGVDFSPRGESFAVVCIQGKSDYVRFMDLGDRDVQEIKRILSQFSRTNRSNKYFDLPTNMDKRWFL